MLIFITWPHVNPYIYSFTKPVVLPMHIRVCGVCHRDRAVCVKNWHKPLGYSKIILNSKQLNARNTIARFSYRERRGDVGLVRVFRPHVCMCVELVKWKLQKGTQIITRFSPKITATQINKVLLNSVRKFVVRKLLEVFYKLRYIYFFV